MASEYLTLGRGEVFFCPFASGTTLPSPPNFLSLGNCPEFNLNVGFEELVHMDSRRGFKEEDVNAIVSRTATATITTDDCKPQNLAWFFMGTSSTVAQASGVGNSESIASAVLGATYALGFTDGNPTGSRAISNVVVETNPAGTTYTEGSDYTFDAETGDVTLLETGSISNGAALTVTYDTGAVSNTVIISGNTQVEGALRFKPENAIGRNVVTLLPYVKIRPSGDMALIGDDWVQFQFDCRALKLPNRELIYGVDQNVV